MVLYRKYRPQKLAELDLNAIRERLVKILASAYLPHAYLFAGPKGTGKTSAGRIIAKILNCENRSKKGDQKSAKDRSKPAIDGKKSMVDLEPCNKCETCRQITSGRHLDVLEIDAASNRGIDEIRELRDKIKFAPVSSRFKVYIIDEVHMLTKEAFNALLKTLEEPPPHAVFILATTEPDKLPDTIVSRCVQFVFHKAAIDEIVSSLKRVVAGEKISMSDEALAAIAKFSDGSFRDATKLLEQAISENKRSEDEILKLYGKDHLSAEKFLKLLADKKTKETLETIYEMGQNGVDFRFFISEVLNFLHKLLLFKHGVEEEKVSDDYLDIFTTREVNLLARIFSKVYVDLKFAAKPEIPLEVAVVEWCETKSKN